MTDTPIAASAETILQKIEAAVSNTVHTIDQDLIAFVGKVKTGAEVAAADIDAAIKAIAAHISNIDSGLKSVETWLPQIKAVATAAGAPPSALSAVDAALADAKQVVSGLDAVAASANAGQNDVQAIVAGVAGVQQAASAHANLIANLALVTTPAPTTTVTPAAPAAS